MVETYYIHVFLSPSFLKIGNIELCLYSLKKKALTVREGSDVIQQLNFPAVVA